MPPSRGRALPRLVIDRPPPCKDGHQRRLMVYQRLAAFALASVQVPLSPQRDTTPSLLLTRERRRRTQMPGEAPGTRPLLPPLLLLVLFSC